MSHTDLPVKDPDYGQPVPNPGLEEHVERWTDADLYARYGLTDDEIAFIEKVVRPMDLNADE